jgi:hypothetical protein
MKTAMQDLIEHLEILKCRLDMVDVDSIIEYATFSLQNEKEQIIEAFLECWKANMPDGFECKLNAKDYYNQTYNQNK